MTSSMTTIPTGRRTGFACPVCQKRAVLVRDLDRYFHEDGSENVTCWLDILHKSIAE